MTRHQNYSTTETSVSLYILSNMGRQITEWRSYKQNYTLGQMYGTILENKQYLAMVENLRKQAPVNRTKMLEQSMTLMNGLGFNLCVAPQSLVMRSVAYFGIGVGCQNRSPRNIKQRLRQTRIGLGPIDVNLQTEELHCNYSVLIESLEQEESSLL